jgi:hypothetical protein
MKLLTIETASRQGTLWDQEQGTQPVSPPAIALCPSGDCTLIPISRRYRYLKKSALPGIPPGALRGKLAPSKHRQPFRGHKGVGETGSWGNRELGHFEVSVSARVTRKIAW